MLKILKCIFYLIIIFCTIKCTIHDYSTSLNLPVNEFEKGYKKINLSYEILPGADPRPSHTNGGSITATFGFAGNNGIDTKIWSSENNFGISTNLYFSKIISDNFRFYSCPRIGFTTDVFGNGLALGCSGIFQKTFNNNSFYSGIGLAFGKELSDPIVGNIILLNIGFSKRIKNLYLNIEFNPSLQKWLGNTRNETNYFGVANSSFSIGYVF